MKKKKRNDYVEALGIALIVGGTASGIGASIVFLFYAIQAALQ